MSAAIAGGMPCRPVSALIRLTLGVLDPNSGGKACEEGRESAQKRFTVGTSDQMAQET
jgi:hypothetical protein